MFTRQELIELRERAESEAGIEGLNSGWKRAYLTLADAADRLDAMIARTADNPINDNVSIGAMDATPTPPLSGADG